MGIKSQYLGEINIPEEHRAEYAQQALKLLRAGGMVTVEPVQLYGHKLYLLSPPELDEEDGKAVGHYNYLDENSGERWCLNAKDGWFGCGKIIGSCYYSTIAAVHLLCRNAHQRLSGAGKDLYQMDQLCAGHTVYEPAGDTAVGDRQAASTGR